MKLASAICILSSFLVILVISCGGEGGLPVPTGVTAARGVRQVTVSWSDLPDADSFTIYWDTLPGVTKADNSISGVTSPYIHTNLPNGVTYYYAVSALYPSGESGLSTEVSAAPSFANQVLSKFFATDKEPNDNFGFSVAMDGDYMIVGANLEDGGVGNPKADAGAAYVFHRESDGSWDSGVKLIAPDADAGDNFGNSVSISGDYVIVGAYLEDGAGDLLPEAGAAYIFNRTGVNTWDGGTKIVASDAQSQDYFGISVGISGDYAIVGAYGEAGAGDALPLAGAAYIYQRTDLNSWDSETKITASDAQTIDFFGYSVGISGDYAIVGAWLEDGGSGDPAADAGAAYIFQRTGPNEWANQTKISSEFIDRQPNDYFGCLVSISGDYAVAGAYGEDGGPGDPLSEAGAAYVFHRTGGNTWDIGTKLTAQDAEPSDLFGFAVAISGDHVIAGAHFEDAGVLNISNAGAAYIFHREDTNTWDAGVKIGASDGEASDNFGLFVAIDGSYALVGAYNEDGGDGNPDANAGAAYLF